MSIYCSMPGVEADGCPGEELDKAAVLKAGAGWIFDDDTENGPRAGKAYASKTEPCTGCDECVVGAPYIYEGSHIIIGPDSPRGGAVHWAAPASHIPTRTSSGSTSTRSLPGGRCDACGWTAAWDEEVA